MVAGAHGKRSRNFGLDAFFAAYLLTAFMQSIYISQVPVSLVAALYLGLVLAVLGYLHILFASTIIALGIASSFVLVSAESRLSDLAVSKFAIGAFLFFFTLFAAPRLIAQFPKSFGRAITIVLWIFCLTFFLDYIGLVSFKALGIVRLWSADGITEIQLAKDLRTSGLFSEPSWYCLATLALLTALWRLNSVSALLLLAISASILLSRSATGLAGLGILVAGILFAKLRSDHQEALSRSTMQKLLIITVTATALVAGASLAAVSGIASEAMSELIGRALAKIYDPTSSDSGAIRFLTPLPVIQEVSDSSPLFGLGASAINQTMSGKIGTAVLPFNVFIELGLYGVSVYTLSILWVIRRFRPNLVQISLSLLNLFTLGFPTSPFQSAMLALLLVGAENLTPSKKQRRSADLTVRIRAVGR